MSASALPSLASRPTFQPSPAPTSPPPPARTPPFSRADRDRSNRSNPSHLTDPTHPTHPPNSSPGTYPPLPSSPPLGAGASASRQLNPKHRDDGVSLSDFLSSPPGDREVAASTDFGPSMPHGRSPFDTGPGSSANYDYSYSYGHGSGSGWGSSTSAGGSNPRPRAGAGNSEPTHTVNATNGHISGVGIQAQDQEQEQEQVQAEGHGHGPGAVSVAGPTDWEAAFEARRREEWERKVQEDLRGWRGGNGPARSAYSRTALPGRSYFNQPVTGRIGAHLPKEIVRIERDWSGGEVCQFETSFPMELEGRITPTQFHTFVTSLNAHLSSAYSLRGAAWDNLLAIASWWTSLWWHTSHFEKELQNAEALIAKTNREVFNPKGLNALSPRDVALQFLEIEYY